MRREFKINRAKSYYIIITAFIVSLIILLLIFDSNRKNLAAKLSNAALTDQARQIPSDDNSIQMMQSIQKLMSDLAANPDDYNLNVKAANAYFDIGKYQQAIKYYKKANSIRLVTEVQIDLGICYFNLGKLDSALITMQYGLKINPNHKQGLYNIGIVLYNMGQTDKAIEKWKQLIQHYPSSAEANNARQYINELKSTQTGK